MQRNICQSKTVIETIGFQGLYGVRAVCVGPHTWTTPIRRLHPCLPARFVKVLKDTAEALASKEYLKSVFSSWCYISCHLGPLLSWQHQYNSKCKVAWKFIKLPWFVCSAIFEWSKPACDTKRLSGPPVSHFSPAHHYCFLSYFPPRGINLLVFCSLMLSSAVHGPLFAGLSSALQHVCTRTSWSRVYLLAEWECLTHLLPLCFSVLLLLSVISVFIRCIAIPRCCETKLCACAPVRVRHRIYMVRVRIRSCFFILTARNCLVFAENIT